MERYNLIEQDKFPKIIWQTYEVDYNDLRDDYKMASMTWKNLNPEWEYKYCNAEQRRKYIKEYDEKILEFYDICDGVSQSDIWRFVVLYEYGGVYSDMDSVCTMPLNDMFNNLPISKDVVCFPTPGDSIVTGTFAARKKSNVFKNTIETIAYGENVSQYDGPYAHIGWKIIYPTILKNKEDIDFLFVAVGHQAGFGDQFKYSSNFDVFYHNKHIKYCDLAKQNNWDF